MNIITKDKLLSILDANFIEYRELNGGNHIKIYDTENTYNYYPSSQKFHTDGLTVKDRGIKKLLSLLNININELNSNTIDLITNSKVDRLSKYQCIIKDKSEFIVPFTIDFNIQNIGNDYKIKQIADGWQIKTNGDVLLTSTFDLTFVNQKNENEIIL